MTKMALSVRLAAILSGALALGACSDGSGFGGFGGLDFDLRGTGRATRHLGRGARFVGVGPAPGRTRRDLLSRLSGGGRPTRRHGANRGGPDRASGERVGQPQRAADERGPCATARSWPCPAGSANPARVAPAPLTSSTWPQVGHRPSRRRTRPARRRRTEPPPGETGRNRLFHRASLYGVSVDALADWNGLGPSLGLRVGQYLLIPNGAVRQRQHPGGRRGDTRHRLGHAFAALVGPGACPPKT